MSSVEREPRARVELVALPSLRDEWAALAPRARTTNAFVNWAFLDTWWEHFHRAREGRIYLVRDASGEPIGIVPLYVEEVATRLGVVSVLRNVGFGDVVLPDFLDALVERGREEEVAQALEPVLLADDAWEYAEFSDLDPEGSLPRIASTWARRRVFEAQSEARAICPYIELPADFETYLMGRNPHFRQQLRRYRRKLHKDFAVEWKQVGVDLDVYAGIEQLARLHQERMESTDRGGNFRKGDYLDFHRDLALRLEGSDALYFWVLFIEGAPAATHYGFVSGRTYYGYQMGFTRRYHKYSPGHYMTGVVMEKLIERGVTEMNLLRGTDSWKYRWTESERRTSTVTLFRDDWRSHLANAKVRLSASPPLVARYLLGRDTFDELRASWKRFTQVLAPPRSAGRKKP